MHDVHAQRFQDSNERTDACSCLGLRRALWKRQSPELMAIFFLPKVRAMLSHSSEMVRKTSLVFFPAASKYL